MSTDAVVLLSGGLDSVTAAAEYTGNSRLGLVVTPTLAMTVRYGARHERYEVAAAKKLAQHYGWEHIVYDASSSYLGRSPLLDRSAPLPTDDPAQTEGVSPCYVPGRNIMLIATAAAIAESRKQRYVIFGANADDSRFPDCRAEFVWSINRVLALGLRDEVRVLAPNLTKTKANVVARAVDLGVPIHLTRSCYADASSPCGVCHACQYRRAAFESVGVPDPALLAPREGAE